MALLDGEAFCGPVTAAEPCGPDLDASFDLEFSGFLARIEGELPMSFFTFKRSDIDFSAELGTIRALSRRTRDLRLLVIYAKLAVLDRDLPEFANALGITARVLAERWEHVHPRPEAGRRDLRAATLTALDDLPQVILPLQHLPLAEGRRSGAVTYRMVQIATGKIQAREGETATDADALDRVFQDVDPKGLRARRDLFAAVVAAVDRIDATSIAAAGHERRIRLGGLQAAAGEIVAFLDAQLARIDPAPAPSPSAGAAEGPEGSEGEARASGPAPSAGAPASRAAAAAGLRAVEVYFERCEPSSPALAVVRFARQLMGKPFFEVLRLIMPDHAGSAEITFGANAFRLPLERLAAAQEPQGWDSAVEEQPAPRDGWSGEAASDVASDGAPDTPPEPVAGGTAPAVESRADALRVLDQVAGFLRAAEPSNPVPLLLTRAKDLAGRDFSTLLRDMFTDAALRAMKGEE